MTLGHETFHIVDEAGLYCVKRLTIRRKTGHYTGMGVCGFREVTTEVENILTQTFLGLLPVLDYLSCRVVPGRSHYAAARMSPRPA
jgi:hypothetical protein